MKDEEKKLEVEINDIKRKLHIQKIIIIILVLLTLINGLLLIPTAQKHIDKYFSIKQSDVNYNSKYKLNLESAYGDIEAYHPKVLYFEEQWNGYYYWMTFTPYPDSDEQKENPHVVASNDMVNWNEPEGFSNPLDDIEGDNSKKYNSDSHLTYNDDLNRLECYWRNVNDENGNMTIYRRYTTDGVNWSDKETVAFSKDRKQKDYVSPAIIYQDGKYKIWYVNKWNINYAESTDNGGWKDVKKINLDYPKELKPWHLDIIKTDKGYEMLIMALESWENRGFASLYHTSSNDNNNWSKCEEIIKPTSNTDYWDNRGIYRSSMIKKDGTYYVFYSASNKENIKGIGIMYGKDINKLKSIDIDYINDADAARKFKKLK